MNPVKKVLKIQKCRTVSCFIVLALVCLMIPGYVTPGGHRMASQNSAPLKNENAATVSPKDESLRFATFAGTRVHYQNYGQGREALVFIHGWAADSSFWRLQVPAFQGKKRLILIDLPGHGQSDKPLINYTQDLFVGSVHAVLHDARVHRAILIGHSMGAVVARHYYRKFPKQTAGLVIVDMSLRAFDFKGFLDAVVAPMRGPDYKVAAGKFIDGLSAPQTPTALRDEIRNSMLRTPQNVMVSALQEMVEPNIWKEDPINVPALAIFAKMPYVPLDNEKALRSFIPNLDYHVLDGVGHFLMLEKPKEFNQDLIDFLTKNGIVKQ